MEGKGPIRVHSWLNRFLRCGRAKPTVRHRTFDDVITDNVTMQSLDGKVVVVTGAAKRIGRAIALRLAREGARVAIHYHRSETEALATLADCVAAGEAAGRDVLAVSGAALFRADLEKVAEISRLFDDIFAHFGRIDGLVNNAGRFTTIPALQVTESDWDFIHSVNLKATFFCSQQAAKRMLAGEGGRIVNLSSLGGIRPWSKNAHYCASKAGVIMLTRALSKAFAPKVTVNSVAPGVIEFGEPAAPENRDAHTERLIAKTPAGRAGTADEIADAVLFFLTTNTFVTGQVIAVDGGLSQK
jgi:NAD(P)-dependent dehydrogenase (short-subunit alcohol dehydrogenase family)